MLDTMLSVRMDCHVYDAAIVLLNHFMPPNFSRRLRGSAGSCNSARTIVEYLSVSFNYNYDSTKNSVDMIINASPDPFADENVSHLSKDSSAYHESSNDLKENETTRDMDLSLDNETATDIPVIAFGDSSASFTTSPMLLPSCVVPNYV
jgi:hypothetical protein